MKDLSDACRDEIKTLMPNAVVLDTGDIIQLIPDTISRWHNPNPNDNGYTDTGLKIGLNIMWKELGKDKLTPSFMNAKTNNTTLPKTVKREKL